LGRRQLLLRLATSVALLTCGRATAQQTRLWRIGFLSPIRRPRTIPARYGAFVQGLREAGYVEGRNLVIEWRYGDDDPQQIRSLAAELVRLKVDLVVAGGSIAASAAQKASSTVPIVMLGVGDPVGSGLATSLARPGGNATGVSLMNPDLGGKWLEIARSVVPSIGNAALFINPTNPAFKPTLESLHKACAGAGISLAAIEVPIPAAIGAGFARVRQMRASVLFVQNESMFDESSRQIAEQAILDKVPTITGRREFVESGCLISYGSNLSEVYRRAASYVDRILKGAKPGDMPIEQPTSYELVLNAKTAQAVGIALPKELLLRADRVIG
jgi:putative ABC transport system substrate-binding protein